MRAGSRIRKLLLLLLTLVVFDLLSGVAPASAELPPVPQNLVALDSIPGEQLLFNAEEGLFPPQCAVRNPGKSGFIRTCFACNGPQCASHPSARVSEAETVHRIRSIKHCGEEFGEHSMSEQDDIAGLVRAVRARVPMDAAQMLVKETPERIGAVLAELPQILVDRIKAYLPPELQLQASESLAEVKENTVGEMMDPALAVLPQTTTVQEAISLLSRDSAPK